MLTGSFLTFSTGGGGGAVMTATWATRGLAGVLTGATFGIGKGGDATGAVIVAIFDDLALGFLRGVGLVALLLVIGAIAGGTGGFEVTRGIAATLTMGLRGALGGVGRVGILTALIRLLTLKWVFLMGRNFPVGAGTSSRETGACGNGKISCRPLVAGGVARINREGRVCCAAPTVGLDL